MIRAEKHYWVEGNTNQSARNIYKILLKNTKKLCRIKAIIESHYELYRKSIEIVDWLDNTVIKPNGYRIDHEISKNKEMLKKWDHDNMIISDKNPMLNTSSFESIIMFLIQKDNKYLKQLENEYISMREKRIEMQQKLKQMGQMGGSNTLQVVEDFLQIRCENGRIVRKIIKSFDKIVYKQVGSYNEKNIVEDLADDITMYFKTNDNMSEKMLYSSRTRIYDIWNITVFLLSLHPDELNSYYLHILDNLRKKRHELQKMKKIQKRFEKTK